MNEPLGNKILTILLFVFVLVFVTGWIVLIVIMILQWLFPRIDYKFEAFLQRVGKPLGIVQQYSFIAIVILVLILLIAYSLGWV